jgi:hypothetical protein
MLSPSIHTRRWVTGVLLAAIVMATVAPAAQADRRNKRYKPGKHGYPTRVVTRYHSPGSVYVVRRSRPGPIIAGFLGGLFLGATLARSAPAGYYYYDPYCGERFTSLEFYGTHRHRHSHPRIVRVIERDSGHHVRTYHYRNGDWQDRDHENWDREDRYNGDRDDRYDDQYDEDRDED